MSKIYNIEPYFHREFSNDACVSNSKSWSDQTTGERLQRLTNVALPFFSLYKPLSLPLSLGLGGVRAINSFANLSSVLKSGNSKQIALQSLQTTISVVALAGTIFAHPVGMVITTTQDLLLDVTKLAQQIQRKDTKRALETCAKILNNSLYLALLLQGGIQLSIASLATQVLIGVYYAQKELRNGRYLEAAGHIGMAAFRAHQLNEQVKTYQAIQYKEIIIAKYNDLHNKILDHKYEAAIEMLEKDPLLASNADNNDLLVMCYARTGNLEKATALLKANFKGDEEEFDMVVSFYIPFLTEMPDAMLKNLLDGSIKHGPDILDDEK
jgi:tetratricopeptide (TPR) repeat protein